MSSVEGERRQVRQAMITGIRWLATARLIAQLSNWVITLIVIRLLTPVDYGLQAMVAAIYTLLLLVTQSGFDRAIARAREFGGDSVREIFGFILVTNVLVMLAIWGLAPLAGTYYDEPRVVPVLRVLAAGFVINVFQIMPRALVWRDLDYRSHAIAGLTGTLTGSAVILTMALLGFGVWALIGGMLAVPAAAAIYFQLRTGWLVVPRLAIGRIRPVIRDAYTIGAGFFVWMLAWRLDILIGGQQLNAAELGLYAVAIRLCAIPLSRIVPLANELLYPAYARLQDDDSKMKVYFHKALASLCLLLFPAFFGLAAMSQWLVPLVFGPGWQGAERVMAIVALAMPFRVVLTLCNPLLQATGKARTAFRTGMFAIVFIALCVTVGLHWGATGLALAALAATPVLMVVVAWFTREASGLSLWRLMGSIGPPLAISAVMAIIVYFAGIRLAAELPDGGVIALQLLLGIIVYLALALLFCRDITTSTIDILRTSLGKGGQKKA